jgi:hypothetical protein
MNEKRKTAKQWILSNFFPFVSTLVVILNLWLFSKLAPIVSDIKTLVVRVDAQGEQLKEHKGLSSDTFNRIDGGLSRINDSLNNINSRLSRIEGKLE